MKDTTSSFASQLEFFHEEYKLNHLIGTFNKPIVAILDGITMGGGVGLAIHAPFRIATENTMFAMPETKIGLFPDIGASFFLPRLDGELGTYLGLTGRILKGRDVVIAGLATHYIKSERLPDLMTKLSAIGSTSIELTNQAIDDMSEIIEPDEWHAWSLGPHLKAINDCFRFDTVEQIVTALKLSNTAFSKETLIYIHQGSPTSCKVALKQLRKGAKMHFRDCFKMEYNLVGQFLVYHFKLGCLQKEGVDFYEGVRAQLIDKDKQPIWTPTWDRLDSLPDTFIDKSYFSVVPNDGSHMQFKGLDTYFSYPHRTLSSYPTSRDVLNVVNGTWESGFINGKAKSRSEVVNVFLKNWGGMKNELMDGSNNPPNNNFINVKGQGKKGLEGCVEALLDRMGLFKSKL